MWIVHAWWTDSYSVTHHKYYGTYENVVDANERCESLKSILWSCEVVVLEPAQPVTKRM